MGMLLRKRHNLILILGMEQGLGLTNGGSTRSGIDSGECSGAGADCEESSWECY